MFFLAPPIAAVLKVAEAHGQQKATWEEVVRTLPPARAFCHDTISTLALMQGSILRTDEVQEWLQQANLELDAQLEALSEIDRTAREKKPHGVVDHANRLKASAERLLDFFGKIQKAEQQEQMYSPMLTFDHFVKCGINLLNGYLPPDELQTRLPSVVSSIRELSRRVDMFARLYPGEDQLIASAVQAIKGLEAGVGAAMEYFHKLEKPALEDSLRLLGSGSTVLAGLLDRFDQTAMADPKYSTHRYLEQFCRALAGFRQDPEKVPEQLVLFSWGEVEKAVMSYERSLTAVRQQPSFPLLEDEWLPVQDRLLKVKKQMTEVAERFQELPKSPEELPLAELNAVFSDLVEGVDSFWKKIDAEAKRMAGAPVLEAFRELLARALKDEVPDTILKENVEQFRQSHAQVMDTFSRSDDPIQVEMLALLTGHTAAFQTMDEYFQERDPAKLRHALELVDSTIGRLSELGAELQQKVKARRPSQPREVTCFQCGEVNANDRRVCQKCSAVLPAMPTGPAEEVDIIGGEVGPTLGTLAALEEMTRLAEANSISRSEMVSTINQYLNQANQTRTQFEKRLIPLMGKNPDLDIYLQVFAQSIGHYVQGLLKMRGFAEGDAVHNLHSGLEHCREAVEQMAEMKQNIDSAMTR